MPTLLHVCACVPLLVQVHEEPLGSPGQEGYTCILPKHGSAGGSSSSISAAAYADAQRGYGPAAVHDMPAEACQLMTHRSAGAWAVPEADEVAALRVSANGWEGFVLQGFAPLLERPNRPPVVAVEWNPAAMRAAGWQKPLKLVEWCVAWPLGMLCHAAELRCRAGVAASSCSLRATVVAWVLARSHPFTDHMICCLASAWSCMCQDSQAQISTHPRLSSCTAFLTSPASCSRFPAFLLYVCRLYSLGYRDISHSGYVCDERWYSITYGIRCALAPVLCMAPSCCLLPWLCALCLQLSMRWLLIAYQNHKALCPEPAVNCFMLVAHGRVCCCSPSPLSLPAGGEAASGQRTWLCCGSPPGAACCRSTSPSCWTEPATPTQRRCSS